MGVEELVELVAVRSALALRLRPAAALRGSSPLLPLIAAVHPAKQRVEPAARHLPDRARRRARVLPDVILGVEPLRRAQRRLVRYREI